MKKSVFILSLLVLVLLSACKPSQEINPTACTVDEDCVPEPVCHPQNCINRLVMEEPEDLVCTQLFDPSAAYKEEDCECRNNICANKNKGRTIEDIES